MHDTLLKEYIHIYKDMSSCRSFPRDKESDILYKNAEDFHSIFKQAD